MMGLPAGIGLLKPAATAPGLPNMVLGLHMNGSNGSQAFIDELGATVTAIDTAQISMAQSKFGGASAYFSGPADGSNLSINNLIGRPHLTLPNISGYDLSDKTKDFTISFWYYPLAGSTSQYLVGNAFMGNLVGSPGGWRVFQAGQTIRFDLIGTSGSSTVISLSSSNIISENSWVHIAVTGKYSDGNRMHRLFIDGVLKSLMSTVFNVGSPTDILRIGCGRLSPTLNYLSYPLYGYIDDVFMLNGAADSGSCLWTDDFIPPSTQFIYP
jgi:hypothetical protein